MFVGSFGLELGAITPLFFAFREREDIQHLLERATGGRLHFTYNRVGGVKEDLPRGFLRRPRHGRQGRPHAATSSTATCSFGNEIFMARTKGVGVLPQEVALDYGVTGPTLHATGVAEDSRVSEPYAKYGELRVPVPVGTQR